MPIDSINERRASLATELAGRREVWLALTAVLISAGFFFAAVPFATRQLVPVPAFIPAYQSALVICDLITAVTAQQLIAAADRTLYQAKDLGRNRMISMSAQAA